MNKPSKLKIALRNDQVFRWERLDNILTILASKEKSGNLNARQSKLCELVMTEMMERQLDSYEMANPWY